MMWPLVAAPGVLLRNQSRTVVRSWVSTQSGIPRRWGTGIPCDIHDVDVPFSGSAVGRPAVRVTAVDDGPEIDENMAKALAILTAWNESGDGDLSLVEQTTLGDLDSQPDAEAKMAEALNLVSGLVSGCSSSWPSALAAARTSCCASWASASPTGPDRDSQDPFDQASPS